MGVGGLLSWMREAFPGSFGGAGGLKRGRDDDGPAPNVLIDANSLVHDAVRDGTLFACLLPQP